MPAILIRKTAEEPGAASLTVTVPVEQVREAEARATSAYQQRARLPGFRKGKAPAALVKKQFADDIRQQALEDLIRESWKAALAQEGGALKPVADPHVHNLKWDAAAGGAIPEVEERLMSMLPGETLDATVRFPPDFPEEAKRGQTRAIRLTLQEVKRQHLPELDDAFAREVGDFESLDALRQAVREDLEKEAQRDADAQLRRDLIEQIVQANRVVAPRPLAERAVYVYAQAYGIPEERWAEFAQESRPVAEAQVRRDLILDWVVEHHGLRATAAELDAPVPEGAARSGKTAAER